MICLIWLQGPVPQTLEEFWGTSPRDLYHEFKPKLTLITQFQFEVARQSWEKNSRHQNNTGSVEQLLYCCCHIKFSVN